LRFESRARSSKSTPIGDEPGEVAIVLEGDVGLVPLGGGGEGLA
jgi:hypothetical protein